MKLAALDALARYHGLFTKESGMAKTLPQIMQEVRQRGLPPWSDEQPVYEEDRLARAFREQRTLERFVEECLYPDQLMGFIAMWGHEYVPSGMLCDLSGDETCRCLLLGWSTCPWRGDFACILHDRMIEVGFGEQAELLLKHYSQVRWRDVTQKPRRTVRRYVAAWKESLRILFGRYHGK